MCEHLFGKIVQIYIKKSLQLQFYHLKIYSSNMITQNKTCSSECKIEYDYQANKVIVFTLTIEILIVFFTYFSWLKKETNLWWKNWMDQTAEQWAFS